MKGSAYGLLRDKTESARSKGAFGERHYRAWYGPASSHEGAIRNLLLGLADYADAHQEAYRSPIGEDGVLGECWLEVARGLIGLLNGESGRLDCGTIDATIRDIAAEHGFDEKERDSL